MLLAIVCVGSLDFKIIMSWPNASCYHEIISTLTRSGRESEIDVSMFGQTQIKKGY
jgi:hypothetical protein